MELTEAAIEAAITAVGMWSGSFAGRPVANVCFKTYGYISMTQAVYFLSDFKLGHYKKIR
ncbi:hypothetical protein KC19_8G099100 [Ceratodon purpureus]|uniref:Uncharacterized protein n=1 Tax=Ceratodon purpureus TaxID=3225 RepID=A0A8T0H2G2_CERPU|nr:hypothetical protein KC19_8G099100 [Ceratodon purpureus]